MPLHVPLSKQLEASQRHLGLLPETVADGMNGHARTARRSKAALYFAANFADNRRAKTAILKLGIASLRELIDTPDERFVLLDKCGASTTAFIRRRQADLAAMHSAGDFTPWTIYRAAALAGLLANSPGSFPKDAALIGTAIDFGDAMEAECRRREEGEGE